MGRKKGQKKTFNIELAHLMADEYMRMADRAIKKMPKEGKTAKRRIIDNQKGLESSACIYIAISALAFAIEIHFKSILFTIKKGAQEGHDLEQLWKSLPKPIQTWISEVFDNNFDSETKKWAFILSFSPPSPNLFTTNPPKKVKATPSEIQIPNSTAFGMIKGHCIAFQQGRYAYERPPAPKLKHILYNLDGLQLLAWLTRALAIQTHKEFALARKTGKIKDLGDTMSVEINFPKSVEKFPKNESA